MARVKRSVSGRKHRRAILEEAQGYTGARSRHFRKANEQVMHSLMAGSADEALEIIEVAFRLIDRSVRRVHPRSTVFPIAADPRTRQLEPTAVVVDPRDELTN